MRLAGFNFTKINIEKLAEIDKNLKINTNIDISEITSVKTDLLKKQTDLLNIVFVFQLNYDPDFAKIELKGNVLLSLEEDKIKEILEQWKDKKISEEFKFNLFNLILRKCSIKAIELEEEMNLSIHFKLPSLEKQKKEE